MSEVLTVHAEPAGGTGGPSRPRRAGKAARIAAVAAVVGLGAALGVRAATGGAPAPAARSAASHPAAAPGGTLTLLDHRQVSLASLPGRPGLVWVGAARWASRAARLPARPS